MRWQEMSLAEREREYSPSSCLPGGDYRPFVAEYVEQSQVAWTAIVDDPAVDVSVVRYGDGESHTIDVAVPIGHPGPVPILVFIHGGYWQELSKVESRFAATDCVSQGWAFAAVDYTLAPAATIGTIVDECRRAVTTLAGRVDELGIDPARVYIAGSSAGAHLAAMVALAPAADHAPVAGTVLVSGVYELEPLIGTSIDEALNLDRESARRWSPLHHDLGSFPPSVIALGRDETSEFLAQSQTFADAVLGDGAHHVIVIPDRNHFDVILDLARPGTTLGDAVADLIAEPRTGDAQRDGL